MKKRRIIAYLLALLMVVGTFVPAIAAEDWDNPFTDVKTSDWFYDAVRYVEENGLFQGTSETTFSPGAEMSRAMFVTVLGRAAEGVGEEIADETETAFTDLPDSEEYRKYIGWATEAGVVEGYPGDLFGPDDDVTREQMATLVVRFAEYMAIELEGDGETVFGDADKISDWAEKGVEAAAAAGIIQGHDTGDFGPQDSSSRAQVAQVFMNFGPNLENAMTEGIGVVETAYGKMRGVSQEGDYEGITVFKGVPYAAPPVGELRFAPPEDPEPWDGVRVFDTYGPTSLRYDEVEIWPEPAQSDFLYEQTPANMSEDCLYLNITTSAQSSDEKQPVYIWFHGGGLTQGFSYEPEFDGNELAKRGVVVVTIGQRLGVYGLLALPQLTEEQGSAGNYSLMDQLKALEWVQENIEAFGGDPDKITLGGQSGGTIKLSAMAVTPQAEGAIQGIIMESGQQWDRAFTSMEDQYAQCQSYLEGLGLDPDISVEELRELDPEFFLGDDYASYNALMPPSTFTQDNVYLHYPDVASAVRDGKFDDIDVLAGSNRGESTAQEEMTAETFFQRCRTELGDELYDKYDFENLVQEHMGEITDENANTIYRQMASYGLVTNKVSGNLMLARLYGAHLDNRGGSGTMYTYIFSHITPYREEDIGTDRDPDLLMSWHSAELWYVFKSMREGVPDSRPWTDYDFELADMMCTYWANFIKTGNPNGEGLEEWPVSDAETYGMMEFTGDGVVQYTGLNELELLYKEFVEREYAHVF